MVSIAIYNNKNSNRSGEYSFKVNKVRYEDSNDRIKPLTNNYMGDMYAHNQVFSSIP